MNTEKKEQIIGRLKIDIDRFIDDLNAISEDGNIQESDENIITLFLLGLTNNQISTQHNITRQGIRDRLNRYIYPRIAQLIGVEQAEIAGNWVKILNFLLDTNNHYRLDLPPQLNDDNFQSSFGNQFFILSRYKEIVKTQIEATEFYQKGLFYPAYCCFLSAWKKEKELSQTGNPETLIYLNNCLIEQYKNSLEQKEVKVYTLAVVIPFHHNQGKVATEILRGVAQIQSHINYPIYNQLSDLKYINEFEELFFKLHQKDPSKIVIKILVINEPNNIHFPTNRTAEKLCELSSELNIIAVLGHYSSEMTKKAISVYAKHGMVLLNYSSTSNELSQLSIGEKLSFYRLTTHDQIAAENLVNYISQLDISFPHNVSIIYNENSTYCTSYKTTLETCLQANNNNFNLIYDYPHLGDTYPIIRSYLTQINNNNINTIFLISDGGIEPNSLNNIGLISRINVNNCWLAGSATFYQENVINWIDELDKMNLIDCENINIIACIPWHFQSQENGVNGDNIVAQNFCNLGKKLWGEHNLTWRGATAFDAVLTIFRTLERSTVNHHQELGEKMDVFLKKNQNIIKGVTGKIQFLENGDRFNPPTEIVKIKFNKKWQWTIV